jgi:hypothetical protein
MAMNSIELAVLDTAAAIDGSCPLEQIADCSGIALGGSGLQMSRDLTKFKVLHTHSKGLTPPQQAWAPIFLEGFAQLEVKRSIRKALGVYRMKLWTDHANLTRQQTLDDIDVKMLRWISELISDGSEILSLSGRSAKLGDGFSRNPKGRDDLLAQRTKDLEGLIGQIRGFDLGQYSSEYPDPAPHAVPWTLGNDSLPDKVGLSGESVGSSIDRLHAVMAQVCSQPVAVFLYASGYSRPS